MNKIRLLFITVFLTVSLGHGLYGEEPGLCVDKECIDIFAPMSIESFGYEFKSECRADTLYYPHREEDSIVISSVVCPEGCSEDRCEMVMDENQNGRYEREEMLKVTEAYLSGEYHELVFFSVYNYWRKQ